MTDKDYDGMITEIKAGMSLTNKSPQDRVYNQACLRAISIIEKYKKGKGLFQKK